MDPIFIVGTGRSGTHFLTSILIACSELTDLTGGRENHTIFNEVANSVIYQKENPHLTLEYKKLLIKALPLRLVDQCHPNLWRAEEILAQFPEAQFLCLVRDPFSVVFSTLAHPGVRERIAGEKWKRYPLPSPFFGIERPFMESYDDYTLVERAALRWCAHMREINRCCEIYKDHFLTVRYESLLTDSLSECLKISEFLNLNNGVYVRHPNFDSLNKKKGLSDMQCISIKKIINSYFSHFGFPREEIIPARKYLQHL